MKANGKEKAMKANVKEAMKANVKEKSMKANVKKKVNIKEKTS